MVPGSRRANRHTLRVLALGLPLLVISLTACARTRNAVPFRLIDEAEVPGMPGVRAWGDRQSGFIRTSLVESMRQARQHRPERFKREHVERHLLTLSGGGANGAFGAGLLCGWSAAGTRPEFDVVTGISTGALIAPFAFLGPEYDTPLKNVYTTISTKDIFRAKNMLGALVAGDSLADTTPLAALIAEYIDTELLAGVAREHARGRRLLIGTTNLDAERLVIWDMGAIATRSGPAASALFRKVMLASASIPVAFPPVYIPVEADGRMFDEMHVDGGVTTQVFLFGFTMDIDAAARELGIAKENVHAKMYVVRNARVAPLFTHVVPRILPLAQRSITALLDAQALGDLYRLYIHTMRHGIDFNLAYIPTDFESKSKEAFDLEEMNRLFELAYQLAKAGYKWQNAPPGFEPLTQER